ncbi:hypothetical protein [Paraburkholderia saeva]|uniref:Uncharacterized protein n=1 Tax=Paraburkholderia saeva TaxID=2777537 RepID=A0A9N8S3F1_9BURK|nr:hypothetical protein [Paraburkholderia saeva]CAG4928205.1 hypothetical protein LMG31841_05787 [Paraburkholderia saeva]
MLDLFGQVVISYDDLLVWVSAVAPGYAGSPTRLSFYIERWDVASKVRAAKLAGTFDSTIESARAQRASLARRLGFPG